MKKIYKVSTMTLALIAMSFFIAKAQDIPTYPWPEPSTTVVIEPGAPGLINETIMGDTTATGERNDPNTMYVLKRGATYLYTARIENDGYPLWVVAEEGDGPRPIIQAVAPDGGGEASRQFQAAGDLYIKDLHLTGLDAIGNTTDNAMVRLAADNIRVVAVNCVFEKNRLSVIRLNADGTKFYGFNNIIADVGNPTNMFNCRTYTARATNHDTLIIYNSSHYNMTNDLIDIRGGRRIKYVHIENSTVVGNGIRTISLSQTEKAVIKNNLFINSMIFGDAYGGTDFTAEAQPYAFTADSVFDVETDGEGNVISSTFVPSEFTISNNNFHTEQRLIDALPDSATAVEPDLWFDPEFIAFGTFENNISENVAFENGPGEIPGSFITDFYAGNEMPRFMPDIVADLNEDGSTGPLDADFSYSTSLASYTASSTGGPLGDLNWFPQFVGITPYAYQSFNVYPNPANDVINVSLTKEQSVDKVVISNILGQDVRTIQDVTGESFTISTRGLNTGIYFVNFYNNGRMLGTNKILKK